MSHPLDPYVPDHPDLDGDYDALEREVITRHLDIDTLDVANSDAKDFHTLAVWKIREALQAAYLSGLNRGRIEGKTVSPAPDYFTSMGH